MSLVDIWMQTHYLYQVLMQFDIMERMKRGRSEMKRKQTESET